jgi:hypothetical protein
MAGTPFGIVIDRDDAETYWQPARLAQHDEPPSCRQECPFNAFKDEVEQRVMSFNNSNRTA